MYENYFEFQFSPDPDMSACFKSVILHVHDYCSFVYNSYLSQTQAAVLERLQAQALKAIYGYY